MSDAGEAAEAVAPEVMAGEKVKVDIFVGLGTGTDPDQVDAQNALAERFNSTHDDIEIEFVIVPNDESTERLLAQVSGGNPPGLVGPGGVDVAASFFDLWEDVQPWIDAENFDTSDFYGAAVDLYQFGGYGSGFVVVGQGAECLLCALQAVGFSSCAHGLA